MRLIKSLVLSTLFILFSCCAITTQAKTDDAPVLTQINGLSVSSSPGQITITNSSGKDIPLTSMLLNFTLDQTSIPGLWGTP